MRVIVKALSVVFLVLHRLLAFMAELETTILMLWAQLRIVRYISRHDKTTNDNEANNKRQ